MKKNGFIKNMYNIYKKDNNYRIILKIQNLEY